MNVPKLAFEVLFNSPLGDFCMEELTPIDKKSALGLANDFEDGKWRSSRFHCFVWDNIAQTALTKKEREALADNSETLLVRAAQNLRLSKKTDDIGKGSEIAEICLYGIMKHYYGALPVVPKIYHKQNVQDNAKGADGVHIVLEGDDSFSIWFGEAKFYSSIEDARLASIIQSVNNSLLTEKLKKENSIILDLNELDEYVSNPALLKRIKDILDGDTSIDHLKPLLHIPILILYECETTRDATEFSTDYKDAIVKHQQERAEAYFKKQIESLSGAVNKYSEIFFHLILFPVPNKDVIVDRFIEKVEARKADAKND